MVYATDKFSIDAVNNETWSVYVTAFMLAVSARESAAFIKLFWARTWTDHVKFCTRLHAENT